MGETSVYYVPVDEARWIGHEREAAEAFWAIGVFVVTADRWAYDFARPLLTPNVTGTVTNHDTSTVSFVSYVPGPDHFFS